MEELNSKLTELSNYKAPGVSGSRIKGISQVAAREAPHHQDEVVEAILKSASSFPLTHKLGALYVFDAVSRALPKDSGAFEALSAGLPDFISALKPRKSTVDNYEKMSKVIAMWRKSEFFDASVLDAIKADYFTGHYSLTPPGSPGPDYHYGGLDEELKERVVTPPPAAAPVNAASVFAALANLTSAPAEPAPKPSLLDQLMAQAPKAESTDAGKGAQDQGARGRSAQPARRDRSVSPGSQRRSPAQKENRIVEIDESLKPTNSIRVLSRTLFVGNIPGHMDEAAVRQAVSDVVPLQSLIFGKEKRQAFIKVYTRADAQKVREVWEQNGRSRGFELRARWGVGFGPRDCFDYAKGISVIPIGRLTEADIRWAMTAAHGGTGNHELEGGQVMEEPDIEVGGGISSRVISKQRQMAQMPMFPMPGAQGMPGLPGMPGMPGMPFPMPGMPMPGMPVMPPMPGAANGQMPFPMPMFPGFPGAPQPGQGKDK